MWLRRYRVRRLGPLVLLLLGVAAVGFWSRPSPHVPRYRGQPTKEAVSQRNNKASIPLKAAGPTCSSLYRLQWIKKQCDYLTQDKRERLGEVFFHNNILYCQISKNACTSIKSAMALKAGKLRAKMVKNGKIERIHQFIKAGYAAIEWRENVLAKDLLIPLTDYFKFTVVRHPFARLYSFYKNKFQNAKSRKYYENRFLKPYWKYLQQTLSDSHLNSVITFAEFVTAVADFYDQGFRNLHWQSQTTLCDFCDLNFDYVGRMETMETDSVYLAKHMGIAELPHVNPAIDERFTWPHPVRSLHEEFAALPNSTLSRIAHIYRKDFMLLGYGWDAHHGITCDMGGCC